MLNKRMGKGLVKALCLSAVLVLGLAPETRAEQFMGIEFAHGAFSFADEVVGYLQGSSVSDAYNIPSSALGIPDNSFVALGNFGSLTLKFADNFLTTSGNNNKDLWVFEAGAAEAMQVFISKDGSDWIGVGKANGSSSGVDIDSYIGSGVVLGEKYSYVRLMDFGYYTSGYPYAGSDIDAVGALSSVPVPEPATMLLLGSGLVGLAASGKKRKNS